MACASCGGIILFGGQRAGDRRYCNEKCLENGRVDRAADHVPDDAARDMAAALHAGPCPRCGGPGPVDVHVAHSAWSAIVITTWKSAPQVCCQRCGRAAKLKAIAFTGALGWWGRAGIVAAPVQIVRNLYGLATGPDPIAPSPKLHEVARLELAGRALQQLDADQETERRGRVQFRRAERAAERDAEGERPV